MPLPSAHDINPFDDLDGRRAQVHFLGKSLDEACQLFKDNFLYYQEDLMFMGSAAFCFYLPAAIRYLESPDAALDDFAAHVMLSVMRHRWKYDRLLADLECDFLHQYFRQLSEDELKQFRPQTPDFT